MYAGSFNGTMKAAGVDRPVAVRYAWADDPANANLRGASGLPVAPFQLGPAGPTRSAH